MPPRHDKTSHFLKSGLFDDIKKFSDLEKRISKLPTEKERGDAFEVFAEAYLVTQKVAQAKEAYPFDKIPVPIKRQFRLDIKKDMGVDGLYQTNSGGNHAYQVKFRSGRPALTWKELSTFIGLSDRTDKKLVFTNCNGIPPVVEMRDEVFYIRGYDLDRLDSKDFECIHDWLKKTKKKPEAKKPRPYQQEALDAISEGLRKSSIATAVMACGTGKTLIALWVAERLGYKKILVLLPSLALVSQTLHEWARETSWENLNYLCVCSDPSVSKGADEWIVRQSDLDFPVGTDSQVVEEFLAKRSGGSKVVFSTYQSAEVVARGLTSKAGFGLGIFDEAHKTAGREGAKFGFALDDKNLLIRKRLFLTATPKHFNVFKKDREGEATLVYSMDDPKVYGSVVYRLPFYEASRENIICGYKVLISVVTSGEVDEEMLGRGEVLVEGDMVKARQVANQLALKRATEKYPTRKAFTFHSFVKYAESFTSEGGEGLQTHLPEFQTFHVNGSMPTARREELLKEFEHAKKAVMSNARCLTEGVNVPAVDMVAFMSPKKSRIDIVQATGRAMRKSGRKKKGYILIPLFLQKTKDETIEEAIERADFAEVWSVLQAMQEQDDELAEVIGQMQFERGRDKGFDEQRFREKVEVLGLDVSLDRLQRAVTVKCIEKLGETWDYRYGELVAYKQEHGHCLVPQRYPDNPQLATWVSNQRHKKERLTILQINKFESLGFSWNPNEAQWEEMFLALKEYKEEQGDCLVPYSWEENPRMSRWVVTQRQAYRKGNLSKERIDKLDDLGFIWNPVETQSEEMFLALRNYKEEHGDCLVPQPYPDNPQLATWVQNQRAFYRKGILSEENIRELEELGFVWNPHEAQWERMFLILKEDVEEHGGCKVPTNWKENSQLSNWVGVQRTAHNKGKLSQDKIKRLEELGFVWDAREAHWEEMFLALEEYNEKHGDCLVPDKWDGNPQLATWVSKKRSLYKNGKLSQGRINRLEEIGFVWDARKEK